MYLDVLSDVAQEKMHDSGPVPTAGIRPFKERIKCGGVKLVPRNPKFV